ncbi:MAG: MetQ/NlpA family ABC transporter substrate-binding protein [Treponema sp.]|nr:MetQ/NlpA family ABC transporter substrate-binding protein [Treponema sp.]
MNLFSVGRTGLLGNAAVRVLRSGRLLFLLLAVVFTIPVCSGDRPAAKQSVLLLGVMPSMDYLPLAVAQREGYFSGTGMELKLVQFFSANERDAALQSGQVDGAVIDYTGAVLQKNGGMDLHLTSRCDAPFYIISGPNSGVNDAADLKNVRIAVSRNTVIDFCVDMTMKAAGLDPAQAKKVEINRIPLRYEMLMGGSVEATGLPDPLALMAEIEGAQVISSNRQLGLSITGIVFTGQAIEEKKEMIQKMYVSYNLGVDYLSRNPVSTIWDILEEQMGFNPKLAGAARLTVYTPAALPPEEDVRMVIDWLAERSLINADMEASDLIDRSCLPQ